MTLVSLALSKFLQEQGTHVKLTSNSCCPLPNGGTLAFCCSQHFGRYSSLVSHYTGFCWEGFSRLGTKVSSILTLNPLVVWKCVAERTVLCLHQVMVWMIPVSAIKVFQQCWKEWGSWCTPDSIPNNAISVPTLADYLFYFFRVGVQLIFIILLFQPFCNFIIYKKLQTILLFIS